MTKSTLDMLIEGKALISRRSRWTRHLFARSIIGWPVSEFSWWAHRFCAMGAIQRAAGNRTEAYPAWCAMSDAAGPGWRTVIGFNDSHNHPEVMAWFDRAIAAERAKLIAKFMIPVLPITEKVETENV